MRTLNEMNGQHQSDNEKRRTQNSQNSTLTPQSHKNQKQQQT